MVLRYSVLLEDITGDIAVKFLQYNAMEVGGIEPHTRVAAQGLTPYCDQIVTVFWVCHLAAIIGIDRYSNPS